MRTLASGLAVALVAALAVWSSPAKAASPASPDQDPFYRYSGSAPLSAIAPGTVLKSRSIRASFGTRRTPVKAVQLLYRTTGQLGEATVTVTTILQPTSRPAVPHLVGYLS